MPALNDVVTGQIITPPAGDLGAQILGMIFPVQAAQTDAAVGQTQTILGDLVSYITWGTMSLMMVFAIIQMIRRIFSISETGKFHVRTNGIMPVRIALAFMLAFPSPATGFSLAQIIISQIAYWGAGLASHAFLDVVQGIGPNAVPIYTPIVTGTELTIAGLVQSELCRSLVNAAANNPNLMPEPTPITGGDAGDGYVAWAYAMSNGNGTGAPACGNVMLHQATAAGNGVVDLTAQRAAILTTVIQQISASVTPIAQNFWNTRSTATLAPLQAVIIAEANIYTAQLTDAASAATAQLRAASPVAAMRNGTVGTPDAIPAMQQFGWITAPAWYIEMGRLNGLLLSSLTATPVVTAPTYQGFGRLLSDDVAPLMTAAVGYMSSVMAYSATTDRSDSPSGYGDLTSMRAPSIDGASLLEGIARSLHVTDKLLREMLKQLSPLSTTIADPFSQLMGVGH
ncbi:MAG: DotA/TraY family protein, partial [Rhodopila sp.]